MRTNLRTQFEGGASFYKLLKLAGMIESESFHEDAMIKAKPTNQKSKAKVGAVTIDNTAQQIQQLQGAVQGLTKLLQGSRQNTQPQQIPQFVPQHLQDNSNTLPQASQNQNPANPQGGRGGGGGFRGRGGRGRGGLILCHWLIVKVKPGMTGGKVSLAMLSLLLLETSVAVLNRRIRENTLLAKRKILFLLFILNLLSGMVLERRKEIVLWYTISILKLRKRKNNPSILTLILGLEL